MERKAHWRINTAHRMREKRIREYGLKPFNQALKRTQTLTGFAPLSLVLDLFCKIYKFVMQHLRNDLEFKKDLKVLLGMDTTLLTLPYLKFSGFPLS